MNKYQRKYFFWCENPLHGMFDYHEKLLDGKYRCLSCGYIKEPNVIRGTFQLTDKDKHAIIINSK